MKVSRIAEMRDLEERAIQLGITQEILMENAGIAACSVIEKEFGAGKKFLVCCGTGNNGGDGLVVARQLHASGAEVKVFILGDPDKFTGAARQNLDIVRKLPIQTSSSQFAAPLREAIPSCDVIVDAIFGTGLDREVSGLYREAIELINASQKQVVCLDIPSGINGDTGQVMGAAVRGNVTATFGIPKLGNLLYPGFDFGGKLYVCHISLPQELYAELKVQYNSLAELPRRDPAAHKGSMGRALFIAGSAGYIGAPYFAAMSFLKAGGGLACLATPGSIAPFIASRGSEIVLLPQAETPSGSLASDNLDGLLQAAKRSDIVVVGPGLSLNEETQRLTGELVRRIERPLIIDADGIAAVVADRSAVQTRQTGTILTPHTGEMARLTGITAEEVNRRRVDILQQTSRTLKAVVALKGAHTLTGYPDGSVYINSSGNPGMATAGSGDSLSGAIAAMYCLGLRLEDAARTGVFIHGLAGDIAAQEKGEDGMTAQDILDCLPRAMRDYRQNFTALAANYCRSLYVN